MLGLTLHHFVATNAGTSLSFNDLVICDEKNVMKEGQEYWFWWFFISKFLEFIDTVFLILNRKHSPSAGWYLQVYHHSTTASVAWVAWHYNVPNAWFGLMSNTFVHIVMYVTNQTLHLTPAPNPCTKPLNQTPSTSFLVKLKNADLQVGGKLPLPRMLMCARSDDSP